MNLENNTKIPGGLARPTPGTRLPAPLVEPSTYCWRSFNSRMDRPCNHHQGVGWNASHPGRIGPELEKRPKIQGANLEVVIAPDGEVLAGADAMPRVAGRICLHRNMLLGLADSSESKRLIQFGLTKDAILAALNRCADPARHLPKPEGTSSRWKNTAWI